MATCSSVAFRIAAKPLQIDMVVIDSLKKRVVGLFTGTILEFATAYRTQGSI